MNLDVFVKGLPGNDWKFIDADSDASILNPICARKDEIWCGIKVQPLGRSQHLPIHINVTGIK